MRNEVTKIVHRNDGLYDLTIKRGNAYFSKSKLTMQEVVFELEQEQQQRESEDGRTE